MSTYLKISVFLAGLCVMATEMAAPRLLAPSFGTTQIVWTNIIGTILAALTLGAFVGGRCADRWPNEHVYARMLVVSGALLAFVPVVSRPTLREATSALVLQRYGTLLLSLAAVCLFFAPPIFLLGMISPWAIRIGGAGTLKLGRVAGTLSGLAALGSILGTFATSLLALPLLGTRRTLLLAGALLMVTGIWRSRRPARAIGPFVLSLVLLGWAIRGPIRSDPGQVYEDESRYNYVQVIIDRMGTTRLRLNEGVGDQSVRPREGLLTGGVWDHLSLVPSMVTEPGHDLRVLILGLGAGTVAWQISEIYSDNRRVRIDGVELDPAVVEAGRRFFYLDDVEHLRVHVGDARAVLESLPGPYEVIIVDAYRGNYIPFQLATKEFFKACRESLAPNGALALNVALPSDASELVQALEATLRSAFHYVGELKFPAHGIPFRNVVLLASLGPIPPSSLSGVAVEYPVSHASELDRIRPLSSTGVLSDDRAPVESFTDRSIIRILNRVARPQ